MRRTIKQFNKKLVLATQLRRSASPRRERQAVARAAFTIVELLTVMSIIVILIGLLVPALNMAKQYAKKLKQMAMFHSIDAAVELFNNEFDGYPPSGALDPTGLSYCGAMKLCEAMMGQDMLGFHTNSVYRRDGKDVTGTVDLYPSTPPPDNLKARRGPFLPLESANAFRMGDIYTTADLAGAFDPCNFVLCDVFTRNMLSGKKTGMPIVYYKANTANSGHYHPGPPAIGTEPTTENDGGNIYNSYDNQDLVYLGKPWVPGPLASAEKKHRLVDLNIFYKNTENQKITTAHRPYRADSYILLSAGPDGEYGTADDIFNFEWKYTE